MEAAIQDTPFVKQLAASDRPTREKAFESLRAYILSGRAFTRLDLLKIWRGLFFCMFHTSNPLPQQRLARSLASLLSALPEPLFVPFLSAFFQTMVDYWPSIPSLRLDKYLFLIRLYVSHCFAYMSMRDWKAPIIKAWTEMLTGEDRELYEPTNQSAAALDRDRVHAVLDAKDGKVGDGLRYHVLDVWVDGLIEAENWQVGVEMGCMRAVETIQRTGVTKTLRNRALAVLQDTRLKATTGSVADKPDDPMDEDDGFEGFD